MQRLVTGLATRVACAASLAYTSNLPVAFAQTVSTEVNDSEQMLFIFVAAGVAFVLLFLALRGQKNSEGRSVGSLHWIEHVARGLVIALLAVIPTALVLAATYNLMYGALTAGVIFIGCSIFAEQHRSRVAARHTAGREPPTPMPSAPDSPLTPNAPSAQNRPVAPFVPADVFLSYKREERAEVLRISQRLETLGLRVWFDADMRSGTTFDAEIERQVRAAKCVLVCWSPGAVASEWVRAEATIGRQRGVLAAAILKDCDLPPPFNLVHAEDLRAGIGPQNPEWLKVLERIGALVGRPGLAGFEAASAGPDRAALAAWMADYPRDPLFDRAVGLLKA